MNQVASKLYPSKQDIYYSMINDIVGCMMMWFSNYSICLAGSGQAKLERSAPLANSDTTGDVVIQTIHAQEAKIQDRPSRGISAHRINNSSYHQSAGKSESILRFFVSYSRVLVSISLCSAVLDV